MFRPDLTHGLQPCDGLPSWMHRLGWSSPEERLLSRLQLAGATVYDVGAHAGAYALFFSRQVGELGRVVAFEPLPRNYALLQRNLEANKVQNVLPLPLALGDVNGRRPMFVLPGMWTTASMAQDADTPLRRPVGDAAVETLDRVVASGMAPEPDFIKIDVEGLELEVLSGAMQTLARRRPALLVEIHGACRADKAERLATIVGKLAPVGYRFEHVESGCILTSLPPRLGAGHIYAQAA